MEAFLLWLFGHEGRLSRVLESAYTALDAWGRWWAARGIYILINWYGQYVAIVDSWYLRIKTVVYDAWEWTYHWVVTFIDQIWCLVSVWFGRIEYLVNTMWFGIQKLFEEWWSRLYDLFNNWWANATDILYNWYVNIKLLAFDYFDRLIDLAYSLYLRIYDVTITWYDRIREIAYDWYVDIMYYVQNLPSFQLFISDWFPWLVWLFDPDTKDRLFYFLQHPAEMIWLYIIDILEDKLAEILAEYW